MAVTYYPEVLVWSSWDWRRTSPISVGAEVLDQSFNPYTFGEKVRSRYVNKVWDPVVGQAVRWITDHIDFQGMEYPYPANWGAVSRYRVEHIWVEELP